MNARIFVVASLLGSSVNLGATAGEKATIDINTRSAGHVERIHVKTGDLVKKGDLLLALDDRVQQAELQVEMGKVALAQAKLKVREEQWKLFGPLFEKGTISKDEFAKAAEERAKAQATLAEAQANLASAKVALEMTQVRAPVDGKVVLVKVNVGQGVKLDELLVRLEGAAPPQDSDKIKALLKERRDVLGRALKLQIDRVKQGSSSLREVLPLERAYLEASLELVDAPKERIRLLRDHMYRHEDLARMVEVRVKAGAAPETELLVAQAELLSVRIRLAREEAAANANKK